MPIKLAKPLCRISPLDIHHITLPALFLAGLQISPHCVLMCGALNASHHSAPAWLHMQAGRLLVYSTLGAVAGLSGGWLMARLPDSNGAMLTRITLGISLLVLAAVQWRRRHAPPRCPAHSTSLSRNMPTAKGIAWGFLPCPMLYTALMVAGFSGSAGLGAGMLLAFGLGTMPALLAQITLLARPLAYVSTHPQGRVTLIAGFGLLILASSWLIAPTNGLLCSP